MAHLAIILGDKRHRAGDRATPHRRSVLVRVGSPVAGLVVALVAIGLFTGVLLLAYVVLGLALLMASLALLVAFVRRLIRSIRGPQ
jgi:hypothetical protein